MACITFSLYDKDAVESKPKGVPAQPGAACETLLAVHFGQA